jgi:hypothetical protein
MVFKVDFLWVKNRNYWRGKHVYQETVPSE